jgi:hypothetical protein
MGRDRRLQAVKECQAGDYFTSWLAGSWRAEAFQASRRGNPIASFARRATMRAVDTQASHAA